MSLKEDEGGCKTAMLRGAGSCSWGTGSCWWGRRGAPERRWDSMPAPRCKNQVFAFLLRQDTGLEKREIAAKLRCCLGMVAGLCLWSGRASPWELGRADRKDKARDKRWYLPCHSGKQRATKALSRGIRRLVRDDDDDEGVEGRGRRRLDAWSRGRTPMSDKGGKRPKQCREGGRKKGQVRSTRQTKNDVRVRAPGGRDERRGIKTETRRLSEGVWN